MCVVSIIHPPTLLASRVIRIAEPPPLQTRRRGTPCAPDHDPRETAMRQKVFGNVPLETILGPRKPAGA